MKRGRIRQVVKLETELLKSLMHTRTRVHLEREERPVVEALEPGEGEGANRVLTTREEMRWDDEVMALISKSIC